MITVDNIHISPVKSLGLIESDAVHVMASGIVEDRRFYLIDVDGKVLTQRQIGTLVKIQAAYGPESEELTLRFPRLPVGGPTGISTDDAEPGVEAQDGPNITGVVKLGEPVVSTMWGRQVPGRLVEGDWSQALSDYCGQPVGLVQTDFPGQCYDEYPVSLISQASLDFLGKQSGGSYTFDSRRFRPNFLLGGCEPHQEDDWIGEVIRLGPDLVIQVIARDPRCVITTLDPDTGERDIDTLRLILSYRPNTRAPYFGVYGVVVRPGVVSVGGQVLTPIAS
jgi:uncharacterized protein YcbX